MKTLRITVLAVAVTMLAACTTINLTDGPQLSSLHDVPVPRAGGPGLVLDFKDDILTNTLRDSGYFSRVTTGSKAGEGLELEVRYRSVDEESAFWLVASTLTGTLIPLVFTGTETFFVVVKGAKGEVLDKQEYEFTRTVYFSIWPHVYLFGATENRMRGAQYARMTTQIIRRLSEKGLISE